MAMLSSEYITQADIYSNLSIPQVTHYTATPQFIYFRLFITEPVPAPTLQRKSDPISSNVKWKGYCFFLSYFFRSEPDRLSVVSGKHILSELEEAETVHVVRHVGVHPGFDIADDNQNDIGLLYLEEEAVYSRRLTPVCLNQGTTGGVTQCYVTGWGQNSSGKSRIPKLRYHFSCSNHIIRIYQ